MPFSRLSSLRTGYEYERHRRENRLNPCLLQKCKGDNLTAAEERKAQEKRKQAAEETRANRQKALDASATLENEDTSVLDNLLEKLRNGDTVGRKARRARPTQDNPGNVSFGITADGSILGNDTADIARDMLARLKSDGFEAFAPPLSPPTATPRTRRRRTGPRPPEGRTEWMAATATLPSSDSMNSLSSETSSVTTELTLDSET
jgi:cytokinesis protein